MATEIERKWLVEISLMSAVNPRHIEQHYLSNPDDRLEVRIRSIYDQETRRQTYSFTIKAGELPNRFEAESEIDEEKFSVLLDLAVASLEKKRYHVTGPSGENIEVDKSKEGPVIAEVEFESEAKAEEYSPPEWFGKEVTEEPDYTGCMIAHY